ncbi:hypothetical protein IFM89_020836 [Coptis chinensis]|uniref:RNA-dependent RNA polymerase n=1 Tax=Coptis chinensis TaxID=261450 RepID=A0A835IUA5_9MAGN|nr:hypothetical protein IFM89_020836 [Coptis chinensis]
MSRTIQVSGLPSHVSAQVVKEFLERYAGEGTAFALKIRQSKSKGPNPRAFAVVQFTTTRCVETILKSSQCLYYGISRLKVHNMERDIVPKPREMLLSLDVPVLHFGCQVSGESFKAFWKRANVVVNFGFGLRKVELLLSLSGVDYKLELFYDSIWQIQLHRPRSRNTKYLVIQVFGAPRIYEKLTCSSDDIYGDPDLNYFRDTPDDQWVRATDFTTSSCIGQSSAICLELPQSCGLSAVRDNFHYYSENEDRFMLESGSPFSQSLELVPIVGPPQGLELPYSVLFKGSKVTPSKVYFCEPDVNLSNRVIRHFHEYIDNFIRVSFYDEDWEKMRSTDLSPRATSKNEDRRHTSIYKRILSTLRNGIVIGDKKFEFLAFSSSQLRDNSAWMFASENGLTAGTIRKWMGHFHEIRNVAKYAARLGQSFSSSRETLTVDRHEIEVIPDVEVGSNGKRYVFSDGIGKISVEFARRVAKKCGVNGFTPSSFQIRYGGYKGVVAVDPTSVMKLSLRKSMSKYISRNTKLDVLSWSKYQPCFLNRQLISLLSTLGVKDHIFEKKQKEAVDQLDLILTDPSMALEALEVMSPGENVSVLKEMLMCGYKPDIEPFLSMMLQTFRALKLLELRKKTRIFVPNGRAMMGCLDENRMLEYGQVFVQFSHISPQRFQGNTPFTTSINKSDQRKSIVKGRVIVAKNPCLHPGDVRVLQAVDIPALHHLVDCVVFPQKGARPRRVQTAVPVSKPDTRTCTRTHATQTIMHPSLGRPHPNECSGSDLDGDIYFVSWDHELIPPRQIDPMDYTPEPTVTLDHDVTIEEVQEYFTNYIVNDSLGIIANAHTAFADRELEKAESDACIELARLFSIAVDFPKTGVPAVIPTRLHVKEYPDFMEKLDKPTYESHRVIGKLFRAVKDIAPQTSCIKSFTKEIARRSYDRDMDIDGFEDYIEDAYYYKGEYDFKLASRMDYYGIKTEAELLGGSVMKMSKAFDKRRDLEGIELAVRSLKKEVRAWFDEKSSKSGCEADDIYAKASAWYHVTYHPDYWGCYNEGMGKDHFLSFPWCVSDKLIHIKRMSNVRKRLSEALRLI